MSKVYNISDSVINIKKPWGFELIIIKNDNYVIKNLNVNKGCRLSLQHHEYKVETMFVTSGLIKITYYELDYNPRHDLEVILKPGDYFHIPNKTVHRVEAIEDSVILEVSTNHLEDIVRHSDDYGRIEDMSTCCRRKDSACECAYTTLTVSEHNEISKRVYDDMQLVLKEISAKKDREVMHCHETYFEMIKEKDKRFSKNTSIMLMIITFLIGCILINFSLTF